MCFVRTFGVILTACLLMSAAASASDLNGEWAGVSSGNHVMMEMRSGGFSVVFVGQQQAGQTSEPMFFRDAGSGTYIHTFDDGSNATTQVLGPDEIRVTNGDGWTDVFRRVGTARATPATGPTLGIADAADDAAAAAAAVAAQPGPFDRYADDALSVRSSAEVELDQAFAQFLAAELAGVEKQFPVTQCADSADREAFARCLKLRNETMLKQAEAKLALLERERPNLSSALYQSTESKLEIEAKLARESCAKLSGSTAPCDLSTENASKPATPARVIARDGSRALECVRLEQLAKSSSSTSGGGSVLANQCTDTVTIGWCSTGGECERGGGNITNVLAGHSWPVDASHEVRWGACHGANTLHGDPGSKGLQFTCSAPTE